MARIVQPVKIGPITITSEEMEALRIRRDYKRLREAAGWRSHMIDKEIAAILKDLFGEDTVLGEHNERRKRVIQSPFTRHSY